MKKLFISLLLSIFCLQLSAQNISNPYASIGKKAPKVTTVTNGEYEEFFTKNSLVQIGTTVMNRYTGEVAFFEEDNFEKFKQFTEHGEKNFRFLSVDPLANKYPELTPYQFASNTPIQAIDLDGLEAFGAQTAGMLFTRITTQVASRDIKNGVDEKTAIMHGFSVTIIPTKIAAIAVAMVGNPPAGIAWAVADLSGSPIMAPSPQAYAKIAASALVEETIGYAPEYLAQRAKEIHSSLPKITQTKTTTAIAEVKNPDGSSSLLVASSEARLRPAQINALKQGETPVAGAGHAEATIINKAAVNNQQVVQVAASRPICTTCAAAIETNGAAAASPLKVSTKAANNTSAYIDPNLK